MSNYFKESPNDDEIGTYTYTRSVPKIGRNDKCPCGSGKKYKKCCLRVKAEEPIEYYIDEFFKLDKNDLEYEEKAYQIALKAIKDHPLRPFFIEILIIHQLQNKDHEQARENLLKMWRLMGSEIEERWFFILSHILLTEGRLVEVEEIIKEYESSREESEEILMIKADLRSKQGDFEEALELIDKAYKLKPSFPPVLETKASILMDAEHLTEAFEFWHDNFDKFDYDSGEIGVIDYFINVIQDNYLLGDEDDLEVIKEYLKKFVELLKVSDQADKVLFGGEEGDIRELLEFIQQETPNNSELVIPLLYKLFVAEEYDQLLELAENIKEYHRDNIKFNQVLAEAYYYLSDFKQAKEYILNTIDLALQGQKLEEWELIGDYLILLVEEAPDEYFKEFIIELQQLIKGKKNLLDIVETSLEGFNYEYSLDVYLKLKEFDLDSIDTKELYTMILSSLVSEYERLDLMVSNKENDLENIELTGSELKEIVIDYLDEMIDSAKKEGVKSFLLEYAQIILVYKQDQAEFEDKLSRVIHLPVQYPKEVIFKYRALIKYGDPAILLEEPPEEELLDQKTIYLYQLIAAIKVDNFDRARDIFLHHIPEDQFVELLTDGIILLNEEEMEKFFDEFNLNPDMVEYF